MGPANGWEDMAILHDAPRLESLPVFKLTDGVLAGFLDVEQGRIRPDQWYNLFRVNIM
jgi:hypothetical protein